MYVNTGFSSNILMQKANFILEWKGQGGEGELITAGKGKQGRNIAANNIPLYALLWEKDHAMWKFFFFQVNLTCPRPFLRVCTLRLKNVCVRPWPYLRRTRRRRRRGPPSRGRSAAQPRSRQRSAQTLKNGFEYTSALIKYCDFFFALSDLRVTHGRTDWRTYWYVDNRFRFAAKKNI